MPLTIEILSKAEVEAVWKNRARAEDFENYLNFINLRDVGDGFRVTPDKGATNGESARSIKHNFTEAAKERVKAERDKDGRIVVKDGKIVPILVNNETVSEPVIIRWKSVTHDEKRKVKKDGKETEVDVTVIDKLDGLVVAAGDVKPRAPRPEMETVAVPNATAEQIAAKKLTLADGRVAKLHKDGTWHAAKIAVVPAAPAESANGVAGTNTTTTETPAQIPA